MKNIVMLSYEKYNRKNIWEASLYQSQVSILGPVGYGPTTLPLRHSDCCLMFRKKYYLFIEPFPR
jgi:hypothetical protein